MKPPAVIAVGPYAYIVESRAPDNEDDKGITDHVAGVITIRPDMGADYTAETMTHELLHCVWNIAGIDEKVNEEHVVSRLSAHLLDTLRRNPDLVTYLTGCM